MRVTVLGGSGRVGARLCRALREHGHVVAALGRARAALDRLGPDVATGVLDLEHPETAARFFADADVIVSCIPSRHISALLAALDRVAPIQGARPGNRSRSPRLVLMGSIWRYMSTRSDEGEQIRRAEEAFLSSGRPGVILHSSMIYGCADDQNVGRIIKVISRFPRWLPLVIPLPGGGRSYLQPIHIQDVVKAVVTAIECPTVDGAPIIVAGPTALTYAEVVRHCAALLGRKARPVAVPLGLLAVLSASFERCGVKFPIRATEWRGAAENKTFDIAPMVERLGVRPRHFAVGLADSAAQYDTRQPAQP